VDTPSKRWRLPWRWLWTKVGLWSHTTMMTMVLYKFTIYETVRNIYTFFILWKKER
jgi:hypothetical protein